MANQLPIPSLPPRVEPVPGKGKFEAETPFGLQKTKAFARFIRDLPNGRLRAVHIEFARREFGISRASLYRYKEEFNRAPRISSVLERSKRRRQAVTRLDEDSELIIAKTIRRYWKKNPEGNFIDLTVEVNKALQVLDVRVSTSTVRRRFNALSQTERHSVRYNARDAQAKFARLKGHTPEQDHPLGRVQVDSTMGDVWLIHPVTGAPIGRSWITFVLDECTRCVLGFYITLEAPSAASVAFALYKAALPKDTWLDEIRVKGEWPCFGIPYWLYTDNGSEFKRAFEAGCDEWLIEYSYRPVARPRWGGQIERLIGTFMAQMRLLPGAVVKRTAAADRKGYDPKKHASMTLDDLERHLAMLVIVYHNKKHSALGMTPLQKWQKAIKQAPDKMPQPIRKVDEPTKFLIDFLPIFEPTLQRYGFRINSLTYWDENLCHFDDVDISTRITVRRNPHDLSKIYAYHPTKRFYVEINCSDADAPKTIWELKRAKEFNKAHELPNTTDSLAQAAAINQAQENLDLQRSKRNLRAHRNNERRAQSERHVLPSGKPASDQTEPPSPPKQREPFKPHPIEVEIF